MLQVQKPQMPKSFCSPRAWQTTPLHESYVFGFILFFTFNHHKMASSHDGKSLLQNHGAKMNSSQQVNYRNALYKTHRNMLWLRQWFLVKSTSGKSSGRNNDEWRTNIDDISIYLSFKNTVLYYNQMFLQCQFVLSCQLSSSLSLSI